jgi:hypothetical protein
MPIDNRAVTNWNRAQHAYQHYQSFLTDKRDKYVLTFTDLVYVKNFKGGSAIINEPLLTCRHKLEYYEKAIRACAEDVSFGLTLATIPNEDYARIRSAIVAFAALPEIDQSDISGFGSSFASALLHFYFPLVVPILDKRALNGSGIQGVQVSGYNNVTNLLDLYPALIDSCRQWLQENPQITLRELDRELFIQELNCPPFKKA